MSLLALLPGIINAMNHGADFGTALGYAGAPPDYWDKQEQAQQQQQQAQQQKSDYAQALDVLQRRPVDGTGTPWLQGDTSTVGQSPLMRMAGNNADAYAALLPALDPKTGLAALAGLTQTSAANGEWDRRHTIQRQDAADDQASDLATYTAKLDAQTAHRAPIQVQGPNGETQFLDPRTLKPLTSIPGQAPQPKFMTAPDGTPVAVSLGPDGQPVAKPIAGMPSAPAQDAMDPLYDTRAGATIVKKLGDLHGTAQKQAEAIRQLDNLMSLSSNPNAPSGRFDANVTVPIASWTNPSGDTARIADEYSKSANDFISSGLKDLFGGRITNMELDTQKKAFPNLAMAANTRQEMLSKLRDRAIRAYQDTLGQADALSGGRYTQFHPGELSGNTPADLSVPASGGAPAASAPSAAVPQASNLAQLEGHTVRQGGRVFKIVNGQAVPQ